MAETVGDLLRERAHARGNAPFVRCGGDVLSFAEVDRRSDRVAAGLAEHGVAPGERVALMSRNRVEFLETFFGIAKLGAVHVPLNVFLKGEFLRYQLDDALASTVVADAQGIAAVTPVLRATPSVKRIVALDEAADPAGVDVVPFERVRRSGAPAPAAELDRRSLLSISYTSGTTGMPKGCMLSHGWYTHNARIGGDMLGYRDGDVPFTALPLFHAWAMGMVMGALHHGLCAAVEPAFSATTVLDRLVETGATTFAGVGMMGMAMLATPPSERDRAHRLRAALLIPFTPEDQRRFEDRFGAAVLAQMYGQTECGAITFARLDEERDRASVGRPAPHFDVRIVDDGDGEVPAGEVGEIVVRPRVPDAMYSGYWRKPDETIEAWRTLWHHTGDLGRMLEDGSIAFVDRKKDAVRRRGENVSSIEVERAILGHPAIAECAVHAVPSPVTEDDIKACVVLEPGAAVTPEELFAFFKDQLPYFAIPRYVEVLAALPRTATMRVMKHLLRDRGVTERTWDFAALGLSVAPEERR